MKDRTSKTTDSSKKEDLLFIGATVACVSIIMVGCAIAVKYAEYRVDTALAAKEAEDILRKLLS